MTDSLLSRVEGLVSTASALDPSTRAAWVIEACAGDQALQAEVLSLLRFSADAAGFLEGSALEDLARAEAPAFAPAALIGRQIGAYRIEAVLGSGGMADVYRAHHGRLDRAEALKVFSAPLDHAEAARVEAEARAASALSHPNVVTIFAVGEADGLRYIAMEHVDGETLRRRLAAGPLPPAEAADLIVQLADGLAAAHAAGVVHRDLKPENIIVGAGGRLKVLDFGIAGRAHQPGVAGVIAGTTGYMAPEQAAGETAGPASDRYAFGVILREMLTGRHPSTAPPAADPADGVADGEAAAIVRRCLAPLPADRFASTDGLLTACRRWRDRRLGAGATRRRFLWAGAATAAAAAAGWAVWPGSPAPRRVAVLPFRNVSGDDAADYLASGLPATLIERLSVFEALHVLPRSLMANFAAATESPLAVGRRLAVDLVLAGTVTAGGGQLVVTTDLVDVATGRSLVTTRHDEPASALLLVEERIAQAIVDRGVGGRLAKTRRPDVHPGTADAQAYDLYLRAVHLCGQESEAGYLAARALLREALARDASFGPGHVQMAATYVVMAVDGYERPTEAWSQSSRHVRQAIDANAAAADAHASAAAQAFFFTWDWDAAEAAWRTAMRHDGADLHPDLYASRSLQRAALGRLDEALALVEQARRIDPVSPMFAIREADLLVHVGRGDDAVARYEAVLEHAPYEPRALFGLSDACRTLGRFDEAVATRRRAHRVLDDLPGLDDAPLDDARADLARLDRLSAEGQLAAFEARAAAGRYVSPLDRARQLARLGDRDGATAQFASAVDDRAPGLTMLDLDRAWDGMRDDDRFRRLRDRVGLP